MTRLHTYIHKIGRPYIHTYIHSESSAYLLQSSRGTNRFPHGCALPRLHTYISLTNTYIHTYDRVPPWPANTEYPPWFMAMLLMSSMMTTVLPTPAPPKRPILPPWFDYHKHKQVRFFNSCTYVRLFICIYAVYGFVNVCGYAYLMYVCMSVYVLCRICMYVCMLYVCMETLA